MTPDAAVRQWFKEVWNEKNEQAIDRLMEPDSVVHGLGGTDGDALRGPDAFKRVFRTFHGALDDINVSVERTLVDGDVSTALCRVRGHHRGDGFGAQPTGREVDFTGIVIARVRDGRLVEGWNSFDFLTMYQQIGWVSNPVLPAN
jgi:predicted ester cyclase